MEGAGTELTDRRVPGPPQRGGRAPVSSRVQSAILIAALAALTPGQATAKADPPEFHVYVGRITSTSVLLAWGTTSGDDTIGRGSPSHGPAEVTLNGLLRPAPSDQNWTEIGGLESDRSYQYAVRLNGQTIGTGSVRTYPRNPRRLAFLVLGDFGNGTREQTQLGEQMHRIVKSRESSENPIRFVLTTGDNIYAKGIPILRGLFLRGSGNSDKHWGDRFFRPYLQLLRSVPFYPSLGNHDGSESEKSGDLAACLDNLFVPTDPPGRGRYYSFRVGEFAEFFALDTTQHRADGPFIYAADGEQTEWLRNRLHASTARWKIPYFHHPLITAGPQHKPACERVRHFGYLFEDARAPVVFNGHEHNFQFSEPIGKARTRYIVTGAGGKLRGGSLAGRLPAARIALWAAQRHFLLVELDSDSMTIHVIGATGDVPLRDANGHSGPSTIEVLLRDEGPEATPVCK